MNVTLPLDIRKTDGWLKRTLTRLNHKSNPRPCYAVSRTESHDDWKKMMALFRQYTLPFILCTSQIWCSECLFGSYFIMCFCLKGYSNEKEEGRDNVLNDWTRYWEYTKVKCVCWGQAVDWRYTRTETIWDLDTWRGVCKRGWIWHHLLVNYSRGM